MRVVNQITFEAKDDAEALRLASERLGKDAVILSTRTVRVGGILGFFQRSVLMVSAGIFQDDAKPEKKERKIARELPQDDEDTTKERLIAFQKLLEFKQASEMRAASDNAGSAPPVGKVIYSPTGVKREGEGQDSVHLSSAGLSSAARPSATSPNFDVADTLLGSADASFDFTEKNAVPGTPSRNPSGSAAETASETQVLREEVGALAKRIDMILQHLEKDEKLPSGTSRQNDQEQPSPADEEIEEIAFLDASADTSGAPRISVAAHDPLYDKLIASDLAPAYAKQLLEDYRSGDTDEPFGAWLSSRIRCASDISRDVIGGRKVMLMGPTGVGKTTTIAKLAAIQALWEHKNVLLLTSDTYRIAAVDQLRTYAKILGVPIEVIFEAENFASVLEEHSSADLILLDTAGHGQRDRKKLETFEMLYDAFKPDAVHLVLAANMKYKDMLDVVERMAVVPISHLIFTKLDETVSYGPLLNVQQALNCPVSFFTAGQNVPNDIEVASGKRFSELLIGPSSEGDGDQDREFSREPE